VGRAIGTTSRGIGPCYEDKIGRRGIRVADLVDPAGFDALYRCLAEDKQQLAKALGVAEEIDFRAIGEQYAQYGERIRPLVYDTAELLNHAIDSGKRVIFEGAQGTMLDIDHGTYPYVTSSSAAAGGASTGTGVAPTRIGGIIGVSKAYITRVGGGPFPTEALDSAGEAIRQRGKEFGAVTGRPRRCGWFDVPLLRYTALVNGFDSLIMTKLDVLDELEEIPVAVAYKIDGEISESMPATRSGMELAQPIYEKLPGWRTSTEGISKYDDLPGRAQEYLEFLEKQTGVEVGAISTGPERNQTIIRKGSKLESLIA
jgi:adenylosuccinate synthase